MCELTCLLACSFHGLDSALVPYLVVFMVDDFTSYVWERYCVWNYNQCTKSMPKIGIPKLKHFLI